MINLRDEEDDRYFDYVNELRERFSGNDQYEHIRRIAREEANKRIEAYLAPISFIVALWWADREFGWPGALAVLALGAARLWWLGSRHLHDPKHQRHLIVVQAEDLNRLEVIAQAHSAGEPVWSVSEKQFHTDKPCICAIDGPRWKGSYKRIYDWALELENMSPNKRSKMLLEAAKRAKPALEEGAAMAKHENLDLIYWARTYLHKLKRA